MQDKKELNAISDILLPAGYYSNWSQEYYQEIVGSRKNAES
jgi:hypothetical protein